MAMTMHGKSSALNGLGIDSDIYPDWYDAEHKTGVSIRANIPLTVRPSIAKKGGAICTLFDMVFDHHQRLALALGGSIQVWYSFANGKCCPIGQHFLNSLKFD